MRLPIRSQKTEIRIGSGVLRKKERICETLWVLGPFACAFLGKVAKSGNILAGVGAYCSKLQIAERIAFNSRFGS